jgi:hypothetical protein
MEILMKAFILAISALVASALVQAKEFDEEQVCAAWVRNATMGAIHALQNHRRKVIPLRVQELAELLTHESLSSLKGVPVLADVYANEYGKVFLESSVFYGYDYIQRAPSAQRQGLLSGSTELFSEVCKRNVAPFRDSMFAPANRGHVLSFRDSR